MSDHENEQQPVPIPEPERLFYSAATGGFYASSMHGESIPVGAVEITAEQHAALLAAQAGGMVIAANAEGHPEAVTPTARPLTWEDIRRVRRTLRAESDFSQLPDVRARIGAELSAAWDAYRAALTDVTTHFLTPEEVIWPEKPE